MKWSEITKDDAAASTETPASQTMKWSEITKGDAAASTGTPASQTMKWSEITKGAASPKGYWGRYTEEVGSEAAAGWGLMKEGAKELADPTTRGHGLQETAAVGKNVLGAAQAVFSPLTGGFRIAAQDAATGMFGAPTEGEPEWKTRGRRFTSDFLELGAGMFGPQAVAQVGRESALAAAKLAGALELTSGPAKLLISKGVRLTPGQMAGGMWKSTEDKAMSIPLTGDKIKDARARSVETWNVATANEVLAPIGEHIKEGTKAGHSLINQVSQKVSDAYKKAHSGLTFTLDEDLIKSGLDIVKSYAPLLDESSAHRLGATVEHLATKKMVKEVATNPVLDEMGFIVKPAGKALVPKEVTGEVLQGIRSDIRKNARDLSASPAYADKQISYALTDIDGAIGESLSRRNPKAANALRAADASYSQLVRMEEAAASNVSKQGVFSPSDLLRTSKRLEGGPRNKVYARGDALLQQWGLAAQDILPATVPTSGTVERAAVGAVLAGTASPQLLASMVASAAAYTEPSISVMNAMALKGGQHIPAARQAVQSVRPLYETASGGTSLKNLALPGLMATEHGDQ